MRITLIAALDNHGGIGREGRMPWHCPADLRQFREYTMGKPVLMGRKTALSLKAGLQGRRLLIQSRSWSGSQEETLRSMEEAQAWIRRHPEYPELIIAGGGQIYAQWLDQAQTLRISRIPITASCDVFFPVWDPAQWRCEQTEARDGFDLEIWQRIK